MLYTSTALSKMLLRGGGCCASKQRLGRTHDVVEWRWSPCLVAAASRIGLR